MESIYLPGVGREDEEKLSKQRAIELWDKGIIQEFEIGTVKGLRQIHRYLFQDVFPFAGKIRSVNLAKGNFRFAPVLYLSESMKAVERMPENTFDEIVNKYTEMNVCHPFREGNGRATRIWMDCILRKEIGKCVDWDSVNREDYLSAMERSPVNNLELNMLLRKSLTGDIKNRSVYMKGIEASYYYEGFSSISVEKLANRPKKRRKVRDRLTGEYKWIDID